MGGFDETAGRADDPNQEPTRGVSSLNVPGGSRVSADSSVDPEVRLERLARYVDSILGSLDLKPTGRVVEVILRAVLDRYRMVATVERELWYDAVLDGVEILRRRPELLVDLLCSAGAYERVTLHDSTVQDGVHRCGVGCREALSPIVADAL